MQLDRRAERDIAYAACWAHPRRGFHDARDSGPARTMKALQLIAELGDRSAPPTREEILNARHQQSAPAAKRFTDWVNERLDASSR